MKVELVNGPEGSPNFCFGTYNADTGEELEFVQSDWDYPGLAQSLGAVLPDPDEVGISDHLSAAFDWLWQHAGETFDI